MKNNPKIIIRDDPDLLAKEAAKLFSEAALKSISMKGIFTVAVSGGTTPRHMHSLLAKEPHISKIPWDKTHIFWVDERCVSYAHTHSNYGAAEEDLISKIPIPDANVHPMPVEPLPETGSDKYQDTLIEFFELKQGMLPRFDLIVLGIGTDGHTASLFPGQRALDEKEKLVVSVKGGNPDVSRLTMTLPVLNNAMEVLFLVSGEQKADTLKTILENEHALFPAQRVQAVNGTLKWLIDREAASKLPSRCNF